MQSSLYRSLVIVILAQGVMLGFMPQNPKVPLIFGNSQIC